MFRSILAAIAAAALAAPAPAADGCYGTSVAFVDTPKEAAELARKGQKLVLVLHVSGHFDNPGLT